ncbi:MAG: hypothetical protein ACYTBW_01275 [Planctomycetota bacterium]|jgi:hypothetical protein
MALTRAEISKRYRERDPARLARQNKTYLDRRQNRVLKQKEIEELNEALKRVDLASVHEEQYETGFTQSCEQRDVR